MSYICLLKLMQTCRSAVKVEKKIIIFSLLFTRKLSLAEVTGTDLPGVYGDATRTRLENPPTIVRGLGTLGTRAQSRVQVPP